MKSIKLMGLITMMMCFLVFPISVSGVVYVNKNATGANNGNSWADAYTTIQAGIDDADVADEEVWVAQGTYLEAIVMMSGVKLYGGFNGTETELSQRNWVTNVTTIDASTARGGLPAYHVVIMGSIITSTIDGFSITGGNANAGSPDNNGGGIYCASLNNTNTIANNRVTGNLASFIGGGIYCSYISSPNITNNIISGNSADSGGGGISCYGHGSSPNIINNIISGNSAYDYGGGISCDSSSSPSITNNTISGNSADSDGGGISCHSSPPAITNNIISGNSAAWWGGGISCHCYSSPNITNNTISGNSAAGWGGGIYCYDYSSPAITNNTISGNSANYGNYGGGIACGSSSPAIINNTISGNSANYGGGIYCRYSSSPAITNNIISGNSANYYGGGIYCDSSSPKIKNTIFYSNNKYDIYEYDLSSDPTVIYNDFYGNPDGVYYDEGTTSYTSVSAMDSAIAECSNNIGLNPLFVGDTLSGGSWTAAPVYNSSTFQTTLTNSSAAWTANEHTGRLLNPDTSQKRQFVIVSNTATTMTVWGNVTTIAQIGDTYKIFDYHLQLASPCIDAGYDQDVPNIDFDGESRPMDVLSIDNNGPLKEYDIGVDEYPGKRPAATVWEFYQ